MLKKGTFTMSSAPETPLRGKRKGLTVTMCGRFLYVMGGHTGWIVRPPTLDVLDTVTERWREVTAPLFLSWHTACLVDDKIFVLGGRSIVPHDDSTKLCGIFDIIDGTFESTATSLFRSRGSTPTACYGQTAGFFESKR